MLKRKSTQIKTNWISDWTQYCRGAEHAQRPGAALTSQMVSLKMRFVGIGLLALVCFLLQAVEIVPHAFHWSSAEVKIPGSFFGVPIPGVVVEAELNFDLWRASTEIAGEKDEKNLDETAF